MELNKKYPTQRLEYMSINSDYNPRFVERRI